MSFQQFALTVVAVIVADVIVRLVVFLVGTGHF